MELLIEGGRQSSEIVRRVGGGSSKGRFLLEDKNKLSITVQSEGHSCFGTRALMRTDGFFSPLFFTFFRLCIKAHLLGLQSFTVFVP